MTKQTSLLILLLLQMCFACFAPARGEPVPANASTWQAIDLTKLDTSHCEEIKKVPPPECVDGEVGALCRVAKDKIETACKDLAGSGAGHYPSGKHATWINTLTDRAAVVATELYKKISDALLECIVIWKDYNLSPVIGAVIAAVAVLYVANRYTRRLNQVSSTFEFSKRFHEIIELKRKAEGDAEKDHWTDEKKNVVSDQWWLRFFDLILTEWEFRKANYINKDRFVDWMRWRWHEYKGNDMRRGFDIFGVSYRQAWERLTGPNPLFPEEFIIFMSHIHAAPDVTKLRKVIQKQIGLRRSRTRAKEDGSIVLAQQTQAPQTQAPQAPT